MLSLCTALDADRTNKDGQAQQRTKNEFMNPAGATLIAQFSVFGIRTRGYSFCFELLFRIFILLFMKAVMGLSKNNATTREFEF